MQIDVYNLIAHETNMNTADALRRSQLHRQRIVRSHKTKRANVFVFKNYNKKKTVQFNWVFRSTDALLKSTTIVFKVVAGYEPQRIKYVLHCFGFYAVFAAYTNG